MGTQATPSFVVQISNPCDKRWDEMSVLSHNTGHCQSCDKVLTNFSEMSDTEILNWFKANSNNEHTCGFWHKSQLGRPIVAAQHSNNNTHKLRSFIFSILMFLGLINLQAQDTIDSDTIKRTEQVDSFEMKLKPKMSFNKEFHLGQILFSNRSIRGKATVIIKETGDTFQTDANGSFYFRIPVDKNIKTLTVNIKYFVWDETFVIYTDPLELRTEFNLKNDKLIIAIGGAYSYESNTVNSHLMYDLIKKSNWFLRTH